MGTRDVLLSVNLLVLAFRHVLLLLFQLLER